MSEPGQTAYEARFPLADRTRRYAIEWPDLPPETKAIWSNVEKAVRRSQRGELLTLIMMMHTTQECCGNGQHGCCGVPSNMWNWRDAEPVLTTIAKWFDEGTNG